MKAGTAPVEATNARQAELDKRESKAMQDDSPGAPTPRPAD